MGVLLLAIACVLASVCNAEDVGSQYINGVDTVLIGLIKDREPLAGCLEQSVDYIDRKSGFEYKVIMEIQTYLGWSPAGPTQVLFECYENLAEAQKGMDRTPGYVAIDGVFGGVALSNSLLLDDRYVFTLPFLDSGLRILTMVNAPNITHGQMYSLPFTTEAWWYVFIIGVIVAISNWIFESSVFFAVRKQEHDDELMMESNDEERELMTMTFEQLWTNTIKPLLIGAMLSISDTFLAGLGVTDAKTVSLPARILKSLWIVACFLFITQYTANLTTVLLYNQREGGKGEYTTLQDLDGLDVGVDGDFVFEDLSHGRWTQVMYTDYISRTNENVSSLEDDLRLDRVKAVISEGAWVQFTARQFCEFTTGDIVFPHYTGLVLNKNMTKVRDLFNQALIAMDLDGRMDQIKEKELFPANQPSSYDCGFEPSEGLHTDYLMGIFFAWLSVYIGGTILLIFVLHKLNYDFQSAIETLYYDPQKRFQVQKRAKANETTTFKSMTRVRVWGLMCHVVELQHQLEYMVGMRVVYRNDPIHKKLPE